MALREVLQFPDPRLKRKSEPIGGVTDAIRRLAVDMIEVMYDEPGIGLAAPQVGEAIRLIVMDTEWTDEENDPGRNPIVIVNPEILERDGEIVWTEGCLSVPDLQADVERSETVTLEAQDLEGEPVRIEAVGLQAVCFQHEVDHLDGVLFIDRISRLKRDIYVRKRRKQLKQEQAETAGTLD